MRALNENEIRMLLKKVGIRFPRSVLVKDVELAVSFAEQIGWPVVLKISSPDIVHKTEAGAVALNVRDEVELRKYFRETMDNAKRFNAKARIDGVLVEEMLKGHEVIVGSSYDKQFGPVVMLGSGGIYVEIFKDVTFRVVPISRADAQQMIKEIKGYAVLKGVRGQPPINFKALEDALLSISELILMNPEIQELDINPLFVTQEKAVAGDVRIVVAE